MWEVDVERLSIGFIRAVCWAASVLIDWKSSVSFLEFAWFLALLSCVEGCLTFLGKVISLSLVMEFLAELGITAT